MRVPLELSQLKVAGLAAEPGVLWLASIRDKLVARADGDATHFTTVLTYPHPVADVAPSPEGLWLVTGGGSLGRQCVLWSLEESRPLRHFDCPGGAGGGLAFHRARLWLTHRHARRLLVLDPATGSVERSIETEHEVFSPVSAADELWLVEAKTGAFGRFSPPSETRFFFSRLDADAGRPLERLALPVPIAPVAMAKDGSRFWYAPRDRTGIVALPAADLVPEQARVSSAVERAVSVSLGEWEEPLPTFTGRAWSFGMRVAATDVLPPRDAPAGNEGKTSARLGTMSGRATDREALFASVDPSLAARITPGDILVAEEWDGMDEEAGRALAALATAGIPVLVGHRFAAPVEEAALTAGIVPVTVDAPAALHTGDRLRVDLEGAKVVNLSSGDRFAIRNLDDARRERIRSMLPGTTRGRQ